MRKILMMLLVLAMTVCGVIGIAACDKEPDKTQDQGQVEQEKDKDKDKEEVNPGQSQGGNEEEEGKGDEEDGKPDQKPADGKEPQTPEEQKPTPENPPRDEDPKEEESKEEDPQPGEDEEPENPDEEDPNLPEEDPDDEPQGDDPNPDTPTKPDDKDPGEDKKPEEKPSEPEKKPDTKPDQENCSHNWEYTVVGTDLNTRQHVAVCTKCQKRVVENCDFSKGYTVVEASCTKPEHKLYICEVCKNSFEATVWDRGREKTPAKGHNFTGTYTHVSGSSPSRHTIQCANPGCTETKEEVCAFEGEIKQATCTQPGSNTQTCKGCGYEENLLSGPTEALGHQLAYELVGTNQHREYCTREGCNYTNTENCDLSTTTKDATCTEGGSVTTSCSKCSRKTQTTTPATGHKLDENGAKRDHKGHSGHCSVCNSTLENDPHSYGNNNLCLTCGLDGIYSNNGYRWLLYAFELQDNKFMRGFSEIVLPTYPYDQQYGNLITITKGAFGSCKNLNTLYIPSSIETIQNGAFLGCTSLKNIYFEGTDSEWNTLAKDILDEIGGVQVTCNTKYGDETKSKTNTVSTAQPVALPAEAGKRIYA